MKNRDNYAALVIAGLMSSSAAMAVDSGTTIQNGTGTIAISGSVTTTGCVASINNANQRFTLSFPEVNAAVINSDGGGLLTSPFSTITLTGCNGQWLNVNFTAAEQINNWYGRFVAVGNNSPVAGLHYQVGLRGDNIYGGALQDNVHRARVDGAQDLDNVIVVQVVSDSQSMDVVTMIKRGEGNIESAPNRVRATYTYNMTYL